MPQWYVPDASNWHPRLYELYFRLTPVGISVRGQETAVIGASLDRYLRRGQAVLEAGSGTGHYTVELARRGARLTATDASPAMIRYLRRRLQRLGWSDVQVRYGRLPDELGIEGVFDGVITIGVLHYFDQLEAGLRTLTSVLVPGGWAIFSFPPLTPAGRRYEIGENLTRRRAYLRSDAEIEEAANAVGLRLDDMTTAAGVTRVVAATKI
jgi:SAM-dependent methyltransferase